MTPKQRKEPTVKLLTLWMRDNGFEERQVSDSFICYGIWETFEVLEEGNSRVYTLRCVWPMHRDLKVGDERKMYELVILALCHQVKIQHLPKVDWEKLTEEK